MISRLLAVGREMIMSRYFGAGFATDAFNAAYRVPNLLRDLFAEGALSSAFVPTFVRCRAESGEQSAWLLAGRIINGIVIILSAVTLLFYFGASWFVYLLAAPFTATPGKFELAVQLTRIMSPFVLCMALAAAFMGMLNANGRFFIPALAPAAFNVCTIVAAIFLREPLLRMGIEPVAAMAIGALAGGVAQVLMQAPAAWHIGFRYRWILDFRDPGVRKVFRLMLPAIIGLSAAQINIAVDTQLAARFGDGPVSYLNYAFRFMQLPIGLFGVAIATGTMTAVALHAAAKDLAGLRSTAASSLRLAACLTFPATVGLMVFRHEIIELLYERGAFLPQDTLQTGSALFMYAWGLFAYSGVKILVPAFYALNDARTPVKASVTSIALKIGCNFLLLVPFGFVGLALATSIASWVNFLLLARSFQMRAGLVWNRAEIMVYVRIGFASAIMGALAWLAYLAMQRTVPLEGTLGLMVRLGTAIGAGMAAILPLLRLLGVEEGRELSALVLRLAGKRP